MGHETTPNSPALVRREELEALYQIMSETADATGEHFVREVVRHLSEALAVPYVFVSTFTSDRKLLRMLAFWNEDDYDPLREYDLASSPCSRVVDGSVYHCASGVQELFPEDEHLRILGAQSYRGVPLISSDGRQFGHLAVMGVEPLDESPLYLGIIQLFSRRTAAELERVSAIASRAAEQSQLRAALQTAHDPIISIDASRRVALFNRAAEQVFQVSEREVVGQALDSFLTPELLKSLDGVISDAVHRPGDNTYLWLAEGLCAKRADGTVIPVSGTVSRFEVDGVPNFTLILREGKHESETADHNDDEAASSPVAVFPPNVQVIGRSAAIRETMELAKRVGPSDAAVLIQGESGTGKELVAKAIHEWSNRSDGPFIVVNCSALPAQLIESDLFGHEKGSFTGATEQRIGRFERANGGTLFLDEIGELPMDLQPKLLRVLQEQTLERVGGSETITVDVRIVAATNSNILTLVEQNRFREDLYYRLNVFPIGVPPLRERLEDIPLLAQTFADAIGERVGRHFDPISNEGLKRLQEHKWPGNIRELQNIVERALILAVDTRLEFDAAMAAAVQRRNASQAGTGETLDSVERAHIVKVLKQTEWVIHGEGGAAKVLDVNPSTLRSRMKKLGISRHHDTSSY